MLVSISHSVSASYSHTDTHVEGKEKMALDIEQRLIVVRNYLGTDVQLAQLHDIDPLRSSLREVLSQFATNRLSVSDVENIGSIFAASRWSDYAITDEATNRYLQASSVPLKQPSTDVVSGVAVDLLSLHLEPSEKHGEMHQSNVLSAAERLHRWGVLALPRLLSVEDCEVMRSVAYAELSDPQEAIALYTSASEHRYDISLDLTGPVCHLVAASLQSVVWSLFVVVVPCYCIMCQCFGVPIGV